LLHATSDIAVHAEHSARIGNSLRFGDDGCMELMRVSNEVCGWLTPSR
jgi:hypothetical protein